MPNPDLPSQAPDDDATRLMTSGPAAPAVLQPGTVLGNTYVIESMLGRGGMGEAYRAKHIQLGTEHAIKIIASSFARDPKIVQLFREEARRLGRISNAAIANYEGFFRDERGLHYLVTEFVHGESLEQVLRRRRLESNEVLRLRDRLALGLAAAHEMDIVHCDVAPENILLPDGSVDRAKLINFGIVRSMDAAGATLIDDTFAGKNSFASPEQVGLYGGKIDLRSDIYSLGLVLAASAIGFGRQLDMGHSPAAMLAARQRVPDLAEVPASLRRVIAPLLEPCPDDRPPSMRALLGYESDSKNKITAETPATDQSLRHRAMLAVAAFGGLAVVAGALLIAFHEAKPPPSEAELRAELAEATAGYQCASINYAVGPDHSVRISGHAANEDDIARIRRAVGAIDGIGALGFAVQLRIWPFCAVTALFDKLNAHPPRVAARIALLPKRDAAHLGDPLVVDVRTPSFDGYVYVDYFDRRGGVLHLFPNDQDRLNFRPAQNHFILGHPPFLRCWVLGGAIGEQLVSFVTARDPLFPELRPEVEDARAYLASLAPAIDSVSPNTGTAALRFFQLEAAAPFGSPQNGCQS